MGDERKDFRRADDKEAMAKVHIFKAFEKRNEFAGACFISGEDE